MERKKFTWIDPTTGKKYKDICTSVKFRHLIEDVIEEEAQAESFFQAYRKVSDHAEHNIGYFANMIGDSDIREDVLDLFLVDVQTEPRHLLNPEFALMTDRRRAV
jgi:hypothetical protein